MNLTKTCVTVISSPVNSYNHNYIHKCLLVSVYRPAYIINIINYNVVDCLNIESIVNRNTYAYTNSPQVLSRKCSNIHDYYITINQLRVLIDIQATIQLIIIIDRAIVLIKIMQKYLLYRAMQVCTLLVLSSGY